MAIAATTYAGGPLRDDIGYRLEDFVLDPENRAIKPVDIADAITDDGPLALTIEGASTLELTVQDTELSLLRGDLLTGWAWGPNADDRDEAHWIRDGRTIDARLDDIWLRLVRVEKLSRDQVKLTFEQREVAKLRAHHGARKATRFDFGGVTRAEFVAQLARAAGVRVHIPERHKRPPITKPAERVSAQQRRQEGGKGLAKSAGITIKGRAPTPLQRQDIERCLDVAASHNAPELAVLAMLCAGIGESNFNRGASNNIAGGHSGIFQSNQIPGSDVEAQATHFLTGGRSFLAGGAIGLARKHPGMSPGTIASKVEISDAAGAFYDAHIHEAKKMLKAYGGAGSFSTSTTVTVEKRYEFARGKKETSWDAIQRLAEEVGWRAFIRQGVLWYVSEEYLFAQKPQLQIEEGERGVNEIRFAIDIGARNLVGELEVDAHVDGWAALPGMVATVKGQGPADGRWLVHLVELDSLSDDHATITHSKPIPQKPEPAPDTEDLTLDAKAGKRGRAVSGIKLGKAWAGTLSIFEQFVTPFMKAHGLKPGSQKRSTQSTATGGTSDHWVGSKDAYAIDYPTTSGENIARQLARAFGIVGWKANTYQQFNVTVGGAKFRVQILWGAAIGHGDHVHVGIRRGG